jgi:hypothetical protein
MIRSLRKDDFSELQRIYNKFYKDEFSFPDFVTNYLNAFVIMNERCELVSVVGIRSILECVVLTDKDKSSRDKYNTLKEGLDTVSVIAKLNNYHELHAFVQDETWKNALFKQGFKPTKGEALVVVF